MPSFKFADEQLAGVYRAIRERRDVRTGFLPDPLPEELLCRLLNAAHQAPSVGLMQPWRFIVIRSAEVRRAVHAIFSDASRVARETYSDERAALYSSLKLEGILSAPQNICIVCDPDSAKGHRLGRHTMPETAIYSVVCAIQNFWLAARAEGVGVGWVSIFDPEALKSLLGVPASFVAVAYLCVGYVESFAAYPELERAGWECRMPLEDALYSEHFGRPYLPEEKKS